MAAKLPSFTHEETAIDESLGFPKAYTILCNTSAMNPFSYGPPLTFIPYALKPQEACTVKELNHMFPVVDPGARPSENPRAYANLLWEQLDHLGNADFDPALFRVDPYGNVVYLHADSASPLAWDIDHWFPCQRGGKTVPSNLRILQWQACRKKNNKLDFLIPWWDLQLGISVNQFLLIFSSNNSVYRSRAFSYLFPNSGDEELNAQQTVESHSFPRQFMDARKKLGLAPAAISRSRNSSDATVLKPVDLNISADMKSLNKEEDAADQAVKRLTPRISENENYRSGMDNIDKNPYQTILRARDSLRQREEVKKKHQAINQLDEELNDLMEKSDTERIVIQELEAVLLGRRRRVEKWRRLAEAQASYHALLEKMIRDAMHQTIVYKQQLRMNQAATNALMARLEAQREICDSSENVLRRKYKQRDELEKQAMDPCRQRRKRLRAGDALLDDLQEHGSGSSLFSRRRIRKPTKKELREFLDEELRASKCEDEVAAPSGEIHSCSSSRPEPSILLCRSQIGAAEKSNARKIKDELYQNSKLKGKLVGEGSSTKRTNGQENSLLYKVEEGYCSATAKDQELTTRREYNVATMKESLKQWHLLQCPHEQEEQNEEYRKQVGKKNVERWLQRLLENSSPTLLKNNP